MSVVIVNHNYGRFLGEAIASVLDQTSPAFEVIVVDDGSTDESHEVVRSFGSRIRAIRQENRGVSAARNRGIGESRGELVAFLDADDWWLPEKLARQVEWFRRESVGMVYSGLRYVDVCGKVLSTTTSGQRGRVLEDLALLRAPGVPASGSSAVVRRSVLERVGGFDEELSTSADWDMWRRVACHYEIEIVPEPLTVYRQHGSSMHLRVEILERDMLRAFSSMFEDPAALAVHPLRHRCYANLYLMIAGSYFHARSPLKGVEYVARGLARWPPSIGRILWRPLRHLARPLVATDRLGRHRKTDPV